MSTLWSKLTRRASATRMVLNEAEPLLLLHMVLFAATVPVLMRLRMRRLQRLLEPSHPPVSASPHVVSAIVRHLQLARRVASPLVGSGCLTRGVTLYYFLRRAGLDVSLCFGMGHVAGDIAGHCWLSLAGTPYLERDDPRLLYSRIFSIPADAGGMPPLRSHAAQSGRE